MGTVLVRTQTISAGGVEFAYRQLGPDTGVPVVFLTHLAAVLDNWDPRIVDGIAARHRVITFDSRGVGASSGSTPATIEQMASAGRVARPGGRVALCNWSRRDDSDLFRVLAPLRALQPPEPSPPPATPAVGKPGVLERLARRARLEPISSAEVDIPFQAPDEQTLARALIASGGAVLAVEHSGEDAVRTALVEAAAPFMRPDGSYRFKNRLRYVIAEPHASAWLERSGRPRWRPGRAAIP